jgi:branched-chain amino acid transport system permease protein
MNPDIIYAGLFSGAVYSLVSVGLTIIYLPTRVLNFAQGQAVVLGAIVAFQVVAIWRWGWLAGVVVLLISALLMGTLTERLTMVPAKRSGSKFGWIIASFAVTMVFEALFSLGYMNAPALSADPLLPGSVTLAGGRTTWQALLTIAVAVVVTLGYVALLRFTRHGMAIRAIYHDRSSALLMGIPVDRIIFLSFAAGVCVTASAGLLAAPELFILPAAGLLFTIKGFIAVVIGGLGSPIGALTGGLIVGVLDTVVRSQFNGAIGNFAVFALLALVLLFFPRGLFGKMDITKA